MSPKLRIEIECDGETRLLEFPAIPGKEIRMRVQSDKAAILLRDDGSALLDVRVLFGSG